MSTILYMEYIMSFAEKSAWLYLVQTFVVAAIYGSMVLPQVLDDTPVVEIDYVAPMIGAIVVSIILSIVGAIVIAVSNPEEADKTDERDKAIDRFGDRVGGNVLSVLVVGALILVWTEADYFWIANALFGAFLIQAVVTSILKIYRYRRGF